MDALAGGQAATQPSSEARLAALIGQDRELGTLIARPLSSSNFADSFEIARKCFLQEFDRDDIHTDWSNFVAGKLKVFCEIEKNWLEHLAYWLYCDKQSGHPVGISGLYFRGGGDPANFSSDRSAVWINWIGVDPDYINGVIEREGRWPRGLPTPSAQIMDHLLETAKASGAAAVRVYTAKNNFLGQAFYRRHAFERQGNFILAVAGGQPEIVYKRTLSKISPPLLLPSSLIRSGQLGSPTQWEQAAVYHHSRGSYVLVLSSSRGGTKLVDGIPYEVPARLSLVLNVKHRNQAMGMIGNLIADLKKEQRQAPGVSAAQPSRVITRFLERHSFSSATPVRLKETENTQLALNPVSLKELYARDKGACKAFMRAVYETYRRVFPDPDGREALNYFLEAFADRSRGTDVKAICTGRTVAGAMLVEMLKIKTGPGQPLFSEDGAQVHGAVIDALWVEPDFQRKGVGTAAVKSVIAEVRSAGGGYIGMEVNNPDLMTPGMMAEDSMDPHRRVQFWEDLGARWLKIPYVQPELSGEGTRPVEYLMWGVLPVDRSASRIHRDELWGGIYSYWASSLENVDTNPVMLAIKEAIMRGPEYQLLHRHAKLKNNIQTE